VPLDPQHLPRRAQWNVAILDLRGSPGPTASVSPQLCGRAAQIAGRKGVSVMEALRRFLKHLAAFAGLGALIAAGTCTIAHAELLSLEQHLSAVSAAPASQYVGKAPYKVANATEFARMKEYIQSQYVGVNSVHVFAYDEDLIVD
jgi:hypothetical protein